MIACIFKYATVVVLQGSVVPARLDVRQKGNRPISRSSFDDLVRYRLPDSARDTAH